MKSGIKAFFVGVFTCFCCVIAFLFRRKKNTSDGDGIQHHNDVIAEGIDRIERIKTRTESRLDKVESGLQESIGILQRARERTQTEDNAV